MSDEQSEPGAESEAKIEAEFEAELTALRTLWQVLAPLNQQARERAIDYVCRRLNIAPLPAICPECSASLDSGGRCPNERCSR